MEQIHLTPAKWVKVGLFCQMTGHTENSIRHNKQKGIWVEGVHYKAGPEGPRTIYFNWEEIDKLITRAKPHGPV